MTNVQIKTQIIKLAKRLNQFSFNDIASMLGFKKEEVKDVLLQLETENLIKKRKSWFNHRIGTE